MTLRDEARFYPIDGRDLPSVTTVIGVINKPALVPWAANAERRAFEAAMLAVAAQCPLIPAEVLLDRVIEAVTGVKAAEREKQEAATIGTGVHAWISWQLRRHLGDKPGPEPPLSDAAAWAVEAWKDWARSVDLVPIAIERVVYCQACGYAGTMDLYARVNGVLTVLDWKSGKVLDDFIAEAHNTSGLAVGGGFLWIGCNGAGTAAANRPFNRPTDKQYGEIVKCDMKTGKQLKAFAPSGPSSGYLPISMADVRLDFKSLAAAGSMLGSGAIVVCAEGRCMLDMA